MAQDPPTWPASSHRCSAALPHRWAGRAASCALLAPALVQLDAASVSGPVPVVARRFRPACRPACNPGTLLQRMWAVLGRVPAVHCAAAGLGAEAAVGPCCALNSCSDCVRQPLSRAPAASRLRRPVSVTTRPFRPACRGACGSGALLQHMWAVLGLRAGGSLCCSRLADALLGFLLAAVARVSG